jgi:hypothetical protein
LSLANIFRHIQHSDNSNWDNNLGDYAAEYMITTIINKIEKEFLSFHAHYTKTNGLSYFFIDKYEFIIATIH